jgi:hypothetical protein
MHFTGRRKPKVNLATKPSAQNQKTMDQYFKPRVSNIPSSSTSCAIIHNNAVLTNNIPTYQNNSQSNLADNKSKALWADSNPLEVAEANHYSLLDTGDDDQNLNLSLSSSSASLDAALGESASYQIQE